MFLEVERVILSRYFPQGPVRFLAIAILSSIVAPSSALSQVTFQTSLILDPSSTENLTVRTVASESVTDVKAKIIAQSPNVDSVTISLRVMDFGRSTIFRGNTPRPSGFGNSLEASPLARAGDGPKGAI